MNIDDLKKRLRDHQYHARYGSNRAIRAVFRRKVQNYQSVINDIERRQVVVSKQMTLEGL